MAESATAAVELIGIDKWFGPVHANRAVNLTIAKGSIHGIVGENGAGKSTLMHILYGYHRADAGEIRVDGKTVRIDRPADALAHGIGMVHQHFMLVEPFTVLENVLLGAEGGPLLASGMARARQQLQHLAAEYGMEVNPDARVGDLSVGLQQRVEILKALYRGAEVLILDEPTGVLTPQEADHLFRILRVLRDQGKTVVLITHKLREIMEATDRVTVMGRGRVVADLATADTNKEELAELMVGRMVRLGVVKGPARVGDVVLEVQDLHVKDDAGVPRVKGVSFTLRTGEIVGIAGVAGNGQTELLEALAGIRPTHAGHILFKGRDVAGGQPGLAARALRRMGLGHVPEDRQRMGLVVDFPAYENAVLGHQDERRYHSGPFLDRPGMVGLCDAWMKGYDVRPGNPLLAAISFSGGNQQKLVVAREMEHHPDLLLVGQPTRGVDIGAIEFIHKQLIAMRDAGKAVLVVSVELEEVMTLSDRILVMFDGRIMGDIAQSAATERDLGLMMAGVQPAAA
ncbi:MAG: ABC transporter ATP-binding protein [Proteobacteria bacterium]|nr:ABC transporter ATP-binding protein [Pseudomonadota bacterium]MBI3497552.1 ABC transporter ATP-binding protein [Pseudomonadota bacterium]